MSFSAATRRWWCSTPRPASISPHGAGAVTDPHTKIVGDTAHTTDRIDSAQILSLDGKVGLQLGTPGKAPDTGHVENWLVERAAGPFNHPTEMMKTQWRSLRD